MHRIYAILAVASWTMLLWPFPIQVFLASCLACVALPLYRRLLRRWERRYAVALIMLLLVLCIALPVAIVGIMVTPQAVNALKIIDSLQKSGWFQGPEAAAMLESVDRWLRMIPGLDEGIRELTSEAAGFAGTTIRAALAGGLGIAGSTLNLVLRIFIMLVLTMVGILYAPTFFHFAQISTRFPTAVLERFIRAIRASIKAVLVGVVLVAAIQGVLCGIGFAVAGMPAPAFWGMVAAFVAPIPVVGTALVWVPACIYLWFYSKAAAVGLCLWCSLAVVSADNFLRPLFLRGGINAPFSVVLIAVICGLIAFGPVGIVAGPVVAAFALQAAREAEQGKRTEKGEPFPW